MHLAEQNAVLTEELTRMASRIAELARRTTRTDGLAGRIEAGLQRAKDAVEAGGLTQELAHILLLRRQFLPSVRELNRAAKERGHQVAEISVRRLRHQEAQALLEDPDAYLAAILADAAVEETPKLREQLQELVRDRKGLLKKGHRRRGPVSASTRRAGYCPAEAADCGRGLRCLG